MTPLINDAAGFAGEALAGYASAQSERVLLVGGGVVRSTASPERQVAVIMGGGSGHFPAFAGWVGVGFGAGAACGNIFASPSEQQILEVSRAADNGGGLLYVPINYAGDILHFGAAAERLRSEGLDVRMVPITDDIASGPPEAHTTRRGIAGAFFVIKVVGAAAEEGRSIAEVERIANAANLATRTFGVAFSGCTLPGAEGPLFTVPEGKMAIGLGIHGEPGLAEADRGSALDTADVLVDGLFDERAPEAGRRVAVLVNGLGSTKYDELHVVFGRVRARIEEAGMVLVAPVVGEQVTSMDMAGVSVSLSYLDDELEALWLAPADVASFSRGTVDGRPRRTIVATSHADEPIPPASGVSQAAAGRIAGHLESAARLLAGQESELGRIDAVAGDGDHGVGMSRGSKAAAEAAKKAVERGAGAGTALARAGAAWSDVGGGTSGSLWGHGLESAGAVLGDDAPVDGAAVVAAVRAYTDAIVERGKAELGDKTMVDAIVPFTEVLERESAEGTGIRAAWASAASSATAAAAATADIVSKRGRSRIHGERSVGTPDAGAVSFAMLVEGAG